MRRTRAISTALALAMVLPLGCTNRLRGTGLQTALNTTTGVFGTGGSGVTSFVTLSKVVPSTSAPTQSLDLVGDGTSTIGKFCTDSTGQTLSSGTGASTCQCVFTYNEGDNVLEVDTAYHESNLIRCDYTEVPEDIDKFEVKIHVLTADVYSNIITFSRSGAGLDSDDILDLSVETSYIEARRFQCREMLTSAFLWDSEQVGSAVKIYDPFQSERPALNYPLNFYSGNLGMSLLNIAGAATQDNDFYKKWDCSLDAVTLAPWENHVVYSESPLPCEEGYCEEDGDDLEKYGFTDDYLTYYRKQLNWENNWDWNPDTEDEDDHVAGSSIKSVDYLIYHPDPKVRLPRSTFFLARKETGVFNVPVNAALGPGQGLLSFTGADPTDPLTPAPLGFAARPNFSQPGEPCPTEDQVEIPEGFHWVKVWAFRGLLTPRSGVSNARALIRNPRISCDPGNFDTAPKAFGSVEAQVREPAFQDCRDPDAQILSSGDVDGETSGTDPTPVKLKAVTPFRLQDSTFEDDIDDLLQEVVPAPNFACNEHRDSNNSESNWECEVSRGPDSDGDDFGDAPLAARVIEFFGGTDMLCVRFPRLESGSSTGDYGGFVASCGGTVVATVTDFEKQLLADADRSPAEEGQPMAGQANICSGSNTYYPGMDWWIRDGIQGGDGDGYQNPQFADTDCDTDAELAASLGLGGFVLDGWNSCTTNYFQFVDGIGGGNPELVSDEGEDRTGWELDLDALTPISQSPKKGNVPLQKTDGNLNGNESDSSEDYFTLAAFDGENRYDFIYVVSPAFDEEPGTERFIKQSFKDQTADTYEYYSPYTFKHNETCTTTTDNGLPVIDGSLRVNHNPETYQDDCSNYVTKRVEFEFIEHGVGVPASDGDPGNPEGNVYPVCALQPDDLRVLYLPKAF